MRFGFRVLKEDGTTWPTPYTRRLQAFTDLHPKPSPIQGSMEDIFTETFEELVKVVETVTYDVGGIVSKV